MMKGTSAFTPVFSSRLAPAFTRYVDLKRALGRRFDLPARTLQSLDRFLCSAALVGGRTAGWPRGSGLSSGTGDPGSSPI